MFHVFYHRAIIEISEFTKVVGEKCELKGVKQKEGPEGVIVTLSTTDANIKPMTTQTDKNGNYLFTNVFPGKYSIVASHPTWTLSNSKAEVKVDWGNVNVPTTFVVSGKIFNNLFDIFIVWQLQFKNSNNLLWTHFVCKNDG